MRRITKSLMIAVVAMVVALAGSLAQADETLPALAPPKVAQSKSATVGAESAPGATRLSNQVFTQAQSETPPLPSSQPVPETITADAPAASNDANFFSGNTPVQDLSNLLPGNFKNTKYKWYGFVRLDGIFDFNPIGSTDSFVTSSIPVPQGRGQNTALTPRYTRLGFDTETPWESMDWTIKTRIEVDFFNGNTSGVFGSYPLRLRFAWIDVGPFLIGQAASLFMDYDVYPNVIDYQGPPGMILMRQAIGAVRIPLGDNLRMAVGVEQPYSDISWQEGGVWFVNPGTGIITAAGVSRNVQDMPDFTGNVRYTYDYGHLQVAGIARKLTFQPGAGPDQNEMGYGVNVTAEFKLWAFLHGACKSDDPSPLERSRFLGQYAVGRGINRYLNDVNGLGLDATFDPVNGFRTLESSGWFIAYEQWWTKTLISNFTYGETHCDLTNTLPNNTYQNAQYATVNLIWLPVERLGVGIEYLYGSRENFDNQKGHAHRIQTAVQYKF